MTEGLGGWVICDTSVPMAARELAIDVHEHDRASGTVDAAPDESRPRADLVKLERCGIVASTGSLNNFYANPARESHVSEVVAEVVVPISVSLKRRVKSPSSRCIERSPKSPRRTSVVTSRQFCRFWLPTQTSLHGASASHTTGDTGARVARRRASSGDPLQPHRHGPAMNTAAQSHRDLIRGILTYLKMPSSLGAVDGILSEYDGRWLGASDATDRLLSAQIDLRIFRRLQVAMRSSRRRAVNAPEQLDFSFPPSIKREQIESQHELGVVDRRESVVLLGPPGARKSHLGISLAVTAAQRGPRVYYGTLVDLISSLKEAHPARQLRRRLAVLLHFSLLVVDEIRYLPITHTGALLLFQFMNRRYAHISTVLTWNKGFEELGEILGDEVMAAALINRVLHRCHVVNIRGNSCRMRNHMEQHRTPRSDMENSAETALRPCKAKEKSGNSSYYSAQACPTSLECMSGVDRCESTSKSLAHGQMSNTTKLETLSGTRPI